MLQTMEIGRYLRAFSFVDYGDKDIEILKVMRKGIIEPIFIDAVTHAEYARRMDLMGSDIIYKARVRTLFMEESP
jgi:hypothetical protein